MAWPHFGRFLSLTHLVTLFTESGEKRRGSSQSVHMKKELGLLEGVAIIVGIIIGSGGADTIKLVCSTYLECTFYLYSITTTVTFFNNSRCINFIFVFIKDKYLQILNQAMGPILRSRVTML
jgi:hypothetical protein